VDLYIFFTRPGKSIEVESRWRIGSAMRKILLEHEVLLKRLAKETNQADVKWACSGGTHEVGCPHRDWSREQLLQALLKRKLFDQIENEYGIALDVLNSACDTFNNGKKHRRANAGNPNPSSATEGSANT
jgi:hypothetical protein